jgi:hypothetical protein
MSESISLSNAVVGQGRVDGASEAAVGGVRCVAVTDQKESTHEEQRSPKW